MIRVGVNLLWLVPGEVGGSEEYTVRLLRALADLAPADLEVELLVNRRFAQTHPELTGAFSTRVAPIDGSSNRAGSPVRSAAIDSRSCTTPAARCR